MIGTVLIIVVAAVLGLAACVIAVALGLRARSWIAIDVVRQFSRVVVNPIQMRTAGKPGAYAAIIRHRGRVSGRHYETPVGAVPAPDGFVIALPYGTRANWLRNVLAGGSATIVHEGRAWDVDRPEIVPMRSVETCFSAADQRSHRRFGVDECLRVRMSEASAPGTPDAGVPDGATHGAATPGTAPSPRALA